MGDFDEDMQDRVYDAIRTGPCLIIAVLILVIAGFALAWITGTI